MCVCPPYIHIWSLLLKVLILGHRFGEILIQGSSILIIVISDLMKQTHLHFLVNASEFTQPISVFTKIALQFFFQGPIPYMGYFKDLRRDYLYWLLENSLAVFVFPWNGEVKTIDIVHN